MPTTTYKRSEITRELNVTEFDSNIEAIRENQLRSIENEQKVDAFSNGDGKTYATLAAAMAVSPLPSSGTPFKVQNEVPTADDAIYKYDSTQVSGYLKIGKILKKATAIEAGNEDYASAGQVFNVKTALEATDITLQAGIDAETTARNLDIKQRVEDLRQKVLGDYFYLRGQYYANATTNDATTVGLLFKCTPLIPFVDGNTAFIVGSIKPLGINGQVHFFDSLKNKISNINTTSGVDIALSASNTPDNTAFIGINTDINTSATVIINGIKYVIDDLASKAPKDNPTFTGNVGGITKTMVGLGNVDNTSDSNKPISTDTQIALDAKAEIITEPVTVIDGNIDANNGNTIASTSFKTIQLRPLILLESINVIGTFTYNTGQFNVYYFQQSTSDENIFTPVSSFNQQGTFTILKSSFPNTATHYAISAITAISPDFAVTEYMNTKKYVNSEVQRIDTYLEQDDFENDEYQLKISITNPDEYENSKDLDVITGREITSGTSSNISGFAEILLNKTYKKGFISVLYTFDKNKKFLGQRNDLLVANSEFTIPTNVNTGNPAADEITNANNAKVKFVRILSSTNESCVLKDYTFNSANGLVYPDYNEKKVQTHKNSYKLPIQGFGDSIIARYLAGNIEKYSKRLCRVFTYGGTTSGLIRDKFIELVNKENTISLIYVGHNNVAETDTVFDDIQAMVDFLGHQRYLIATTPTGTYGSEVATIDFVDKMKLIENRLEGTYGKNYLNMRRAVYDGYDMGNVKLTQSFVQPPADGTTTVNIYVDKFEFMTVVNAGYNSQTWIPNQKFFKVGIDNIYDEYEIISSTLVSGDIGYLTCKLVPAGSYRVAIGGTVDDLELTQTPAGTSTPITFTRFLKVVKSADLYCKTLQTSPASFNEDGVHPSKWGGDFSGKMVAIRVNQLNQY